MAGRDFSAELFGAAPVQTSVSEEEDRRRRDEAVAILEQERQASLARGDTEGANINAREIDRMQRTNFGKGAPAESGGRDLSAELFGGKDLSAELFKTEAKPTLTQRLKSAFTPKEGPTVGLSDEMTEALKAVTEPEVRPKKIGSVLEREVVEPARGAGFMLRPDFVQEVRSSFANVPAEKRRSALEEAAKATDATGQAARRILEEVRAEDERRRVDLLGRERMVGILAEAPKKPVLGPIGEGGGRVQFPDVTPTFAEEIDRLKVPEEERIQRRLARDEAERAVEAADRSMAAQAEREEQQRGFFDQLTKSFVDVGIPQAEAGFKGLTLVAQADRISKATDRLRALEAAGEGESREAEGLRKTIEFYTKRQGEYFKGLAETQAELRTAPAYAGIRKLSEAKTFEEGFKAFAQDPINIVANLTAQSMPSMLPGLVLGVINPGLGAAAMGGSSFGVEFGGSLLEFAQEKGVDTSDPAQMAQFFDNKDLLREGMNKAGARAGIIGAGDLFLAGVASKTLVPKRITGPVAKNITNLGAQMGTQAVGGGGFEALAQIATEGEITKPGEVLAEMLGELGGAPAEVYTQTRQAARDVARERALRAAASAPPPPPPPPALSDEDRQLLLDHAQQRLAELRLKAEGTEERVITTPEGKQVRIPAQAKQILTDEERAELSYLTRHSENPTALSRVYEIGTEEEEAPPAPPPVSPTITRMREQQRATEELEGEALGTETPEAIEAEAQREEESAAELADRIAAAEAEDTGFRPLTEAQSRRMAALSPSEREAMGFPVTPRAPRPAVKVSENPENIGMTGLDEANRPVVDLITAGAKPFPTKKAAEMGKAQRPDMKILKVADGWMLTPMTEADVARGERAGQRISAFQPGKAGMPTAAHEYIMERGGLTFDQQPNTDFPDENPKVGNRRLFSDKGMSLAQAAELLKEAGYIDEETETAAQAAISNSVKGKRVYTPEGYERAATLEKEAQTREAERAETEAGLYTPEADIYDYRYLEDPFRMPIAEVRTRAEAVGIPYDVIAEDVASRMPDATQEEYEDAVKTEVSNYAKGEGKLLSIAPIITSDVNKAAARSPSLKRKVKTLKRQRLAGKISDAQFIEQTDAAIDQDEAARLAKEPEGRLRGADRIREVLLAAKRRGELSPEAVELAEWFIKQNEKLLDDLAVSVKSPERGTAGRYEPMYRLMILMKEAGSDNTIVHEILHHLERMMPEPVRKAIRKEWMRQLMLAQKKAKTPAEKLYFAAIMANHFGEADMSFADMNKAVNDLVRQGRLEPMKPLTEGDSAALHDLAINLARDGAVPMSHYQYVNPSEFWAVKGSDIVQGRYNAIRGGVLARLKNWLKELAQTLKSVFGFKSDAPIIQALDSLSKSDGRFMTDKMLMEGGETFLQVGRNIYNRRPLVQWNTPDETKLDSFIYTMQDKLVDTKRVIQDIERATGAIDDRWNPYLQEELYHGRTATATKDFLASEVRPLLEEMRKENVSIADLEEYLHNRFAETRNNNIAQINPTMPDGGSGIMTADAQAYLAALTPDQKRKYERLASKVYAITQGTRDYLVGSGLEEQDTINAWESSSPDYVPLNRGDVEYSTTVGTGTGQGYSVKGPSTRTATGSLRPVVNILANVIAQRERAIVRGEKNRVATALYGLALQNPNPEFWLAVNPDAKQSRKKTSDELINMGLTPAEAEGLMQEPAKKVVDPQTGLVTQRVNPVLRNADNVLAVRINGKDRFVFFNTTNPRAVRMVTALKNLDADQLGMILSKVAMVTRYFSQINTQYNPVFGIYNFLRDYQGGLIQLSGTPLADSRWEVLNPVNVAGAMRGIYQTLRAERARKPQLMTPWADLWIEFTREGGQTGYRDMFSRAQERADALKSELDKLRESGGKKAALAVPRAVFNWLADYNETLENAVRLTAYKAALDKGLSKEQAASLAKNLTVNFNRKGQIGVQAGAWYSFFNSSVQGTTRLLGTVAKTKKPGDIKSLSLTKAGKVIVYGGLLAGVIQAMGLSMAGFDEDEPPDFVKDRNFIFPIGDGKYLAWPMPLGYHVIPAFSRIITEWALSGGKNTGKVVSHLTSLLFDAFSPIGNAGWSLQSVLPTIFDPMAALFENKDWTGKPIAKEDFNKLDPTPGYTRAKQNASWVGEEFAYFINALTGGDADKPSDIWSPTPDQIDYLIGQATGGLGREILKATKTAKALTTGEELPPYNIPLVGRFYGNSKAGYAESQRFYDNIQELNVLHNQLEGRQKRKEDPAKFLQENPKVRLYEAAMATQRNVQNLRKQRDALIEKDAPKESVKAVENNITNQMKKLNEKVKQFEAASKNKKETAE